MSDSTHPPLDIQSIARRYDESFAALMLTAVFHQAFPGHLNWNDNLTPENFQYAVKLVTGFLENYRSRLEHGEADPVIEL